MDCIKQPSSESTRSKISKTFSKCIHPQTPSRYPPPNPNPKLKTLSEELNISLKDFNKPEPKITRTKSQRSYSTDHHHPQHQQQQQAFKNRAVKDALLSKLFASLSSIKAAYAELQSAQFPYNNDAIQSADESLVSELTVLSELKQKYYNKCLNLPPPHVTQLLAEIQEQQSNIKTYEITMKQMEWKMDQKDSEIESLKKEINQVNITNKNLEKRLNSSGVLFPLGNGSISIDELNQCQFFRVLHFSIRSLRHFVKQLVREMEAKEWDIDLAVKAVEPNTVFGKPKHKIFALESYVSQVMFDGFNHHNFFLPDEGTNTNAKQPLKIVFFQNFQKLQSLTPSQIFSQNPRNPFAKFCRAKYLKLMHPKMECSFFGNLDQRKVISSGAFPSTEFFSLFAEMARRIWLLHCLAFSFDPPAVAFQVRRNCRFSEVYMESVSPEDDVISSDVTASFTVIPGFKIGKTVVQSVVYLSPAKKR